MRTEERKLGRQKHRSIFLKLLLTMLGHGVVLLLILGVFFHNFYGKYTRASVESIFRNFSERIVSHLGSPPELDRAKLIAKDMGIEIRYEGQERSWATSE
ncbi:hypothetical protein ACFLT9_14200, partial [Acidobacteriota bacterium]